MTNPLRNENEEDPVRRNNMKKKTKKYPIEMSGYIKLTKKTVITGDIILEGKLKINGNLKCDGNISIEEK